MLLTFIIGASYAYIAYTTRQKEINILETDCINVTMEELTNEIRLINAYPVTDEVGANTKPFRFKLTNTCGVGVDYNLNLEVMGLVDEKSESNPNGKENRIDAKNIAVKVDENNKSILSNNPSATPIYQESDYTAVESYTTYSGSIDPYSNVTHEIRIWLDESAGNDSQNGKFYSKVVIEARQNQTIFNQDLRKLAEIIETEPKYMNEFLRTPEDVNKIVASKEAMELIIGSDYLKEELKNSENYTDIVKKQILNSTVVSEVDKYNAGLPFYINSQFLGNKSGFTNKFYYTNVYAPNNSQFGYDSAYITSASAAMAGTYYVYTSINKVNVDDYNYMQIQHYHIGGGSITGTTSFGLYTNVSNDINFTTATSETWGGGWTTTTATLNIRDYKGSYYIKGITRHNGQETGQIAIDKWHWVALY